MKNFAFIFMAMLMGIGVAISQESNGPKLKWEQDSKDYGTLYVDDLPRKQLAIKFTNDGNQPLIVSQVRACCGTRVTSWTREPVMPGQEGVIQVEFMLSPRPHRISRTVTATTNSENPTSIFRIVGEVAER